MRFFDAIYRVGAVGIVALIAVVFPFLLAVMIGDALVLLIRKFLFWKQTTAEIADGSKIESNRYRRILVLKALQIYALFAFLESHLSFWKNGTSTWANVSRRGGRPIEWIRKLPIWRGYVARAFSQRLVHSDSTMDREPPRLGQRPLTLGWHPHGAFGLSVFGMATGIPRKKHTERIACGPYEKLDERAHRHAMLLNGRDYRVLTVDANFQIPLGRDMLMALGFVDASSESIKFCLRQKNVSVVVVVGGAQEAADTRPRTLDLTLEKRQGFVKISLQSGAQGIVPVITFGETDAFYQIVGNRPGSWVRKFQDIFLSWTGFTIPLVKIWAPRSCRMTVVVGRPINIPFIADPSPHEVAKWHRRYIDELHRLYNAAKDQVYPVIHKPLVIVDRRNEISSRL